MVSIATIGPQGSDGYFAAKQCHPDSEILLFNRIQEVIAAFHEGRADKALIPVYNTREGEVKDYFRSIPQEQIGYWVDNVVLPIHLSLGRLPCPDDNHSPIEVIVSRNSVFRQCEEFIETHYPNATQLAVNDLAAAFEDIKANDRYTYGVIESEELIKESGFTLLEREVVSHNRTRFAVLGKDLAPVTGYDATALITRPLRDRVGMLADVIGEFTRRGINILDLQTNSDVQTQKLRIYLEVEGHITSPSLSEAVQRLESVIIQENDPLRLLGSFPRVDMRIKQIRSFGFIGTGAMSAWFANRLENEGYRTVMTGRSTKLRPEDMVSQVDVVIVCVPISATAPTIQKYGPLLKNGQALIILAGESEFNLETALKTTDPGVEVMFVHNLWGPQAISMKDKNATVVRTSRSGSFCSEFEAFLFKHGAEINYDSPGKHDLLMGMSQKLPTAISIAMAMTLADNQIKCEDIGTHSTLTSLYGILAMARIHNQNPRTYAEILATTGDGRKIVHSFLKNLKEVVELADSGNIAGIEHLMATNTAYMTPQFLQTRMKQAKAVDEVLSDGGMKGDI